MLITTKITVNNKSCYVMKVILLLKYRLSLWFSLLVNSFLFPSWWFHIFLCRALWYPDWFGISYTAPHRNTLWLTHCKNNNLILIDRFFIHVDICRFHELLVFLSFLTAYFWSKHMTISCCLWTHICINFRFNKRFCHGFSILFLHHKI